MNLNRRSTCQMKRESGTIVAPLKANSSTLAIKFASLGFLLVLTMNWVRLDAQVRCPQDTRTEDLATRFVINGGGIELPIGAILLVRRNNQLGAIHLTRISADSTEWLGDSAYESWFQSDSSQFLSETSRQTGNLHLRPSKGPGRGMYIYKPGPYRARIGKWLFGFDGPNKMVMTDHSSVKGDYGDRGFQFAPTSACSLSELNIHDPRLRWFRYDHGASVILPLAELPK